MVNAVNAEYEGIMVISLTGFDRRLSWDTHSKILYCSVFIGGMIKDAA